MPRPPKQLTAEGRRKLESLIKVAQRAGRDLLEQHRKIRERVRPLLKTRAYDPEDIRALLELNEQISHLDRVLTSLKRYV